MAIKCLIDIDGREHEILEKFDQFLDHSAPFLISLDINPLYSWYLIEFQMDQLVPEMKGDVDILAGNFEPSSPELFEKSLDKIRKLDSGSFPHQLNHLAAVDLAWQGGLK